MLKVMFFDLDGTLWDSKHPLLQTAWDRLPKAWERVVGKLPDDFNWSKLAGSTDYAVVKTLINDQFPKKSSQEKRELIQQTIIAMNDYYLSNAPDDIRPALFDDTVRGLKSLKESGWTLGIITGNSEPVARHKLQAAGLLQFFSTDPKLQYFGDNFESRADMIQKAWLQSMLFGQERPKIPPLIYVADTLRDLEESSEAWWSQSNSNYYNYLEYRILLRQQPTIYPNIGEVNAFNHFYKHIAAHLFNSIGDDPFLQTVNLEGRFDWISTRNLERGW